MSINKDLVYSIKEVSEILSVHPRKLNRIAKKENLQKVDNRYLFSDDFLIKHFHLTNVEESQKMSKDVKQLTIDTESLKTDITIENLHKEIKDLKAELSQYKNNTKLDLKQAIEIITTEAARQGVMHKIFTNEEFEEIIGTIALSENQQEQITYLRNRISKQDEALISIAKQVEQRNYIEAMDKGYNKPK